MDEPRSFDLTGPLPAGTSAIEASAGTGKTFALSALAVRYIAEASLHPSQVCLVSFTEAATTELRGRVRGRLVEALRHCEAVMQETRAHAVTDPVLEVIAHREMSPALLATRLRNLRLAVAEFDAITISTIHGFCQRILISAGETEELRQITEGTEEIAEVVNDLFVAVAADPAGFGFDDPDKILKDKLPTRVSQAVAKTLAMPDAVWFRGDLSGSRKLHPATLRNKERTEVMIALVDRAVAEVHHRRRQRAQTTFDGVIATTRDLLRGDRAATVIAALRDRYRVVLIDEFQDTDSVQWDIFRTAFITNPDLGPTPAVTIVGDPKQSIYRFRSAEISAYLAAVAAAGEQVSTLDTNWRSDGDLLGAFEQLLEGFAFGDERVRFHPVRIAPDLMGSRLIGAGGAPLEIRAITGTSTTPPSSAESHPAVIADLVAVVAEHLSGSMRIRSRLADDHGRYSERPVQPSDIAILTRSNAKAAEVALALAAAGIPAATTSSQSVLTSEAAFQWQVLLEALSSPGAVGKGRAGALGWFLGLSAHELGAMDDDALIEVQDRLRDWGRLLAEKGLSALVDRARAEGVQARLLSTPTGERNLTDLDHVAEVLHTLSGGRPASATVLLGLLAQAAARDDEEDLAPEFLSRRIDRDDQAVTVMTVHKSKGLEFPILMLPYLWQAPQGAKGVPHATSNGICHLDGTWIPKINDTKLNETLRAASTAENLGEARRLLYVALTRAQHRCVVWWPEGLQKSPLAEVLEHRLGTPADSLNALEPLTAAAGGRIRAVPVLADQVRTRARAAAAGRRTSHSPIPTARRAARAGVAEPLSARSITRTLDEAWRIWSFTGITSVAQARAEGVGSVLLGGPIAERTEVMSGAGEDERPVADPGVASIDAVEFAESEPVASESLELMGAPAGPTFGTLVHEVLEHVDFAAADLDAQLVSHCARRLQYRPMGISAARLARGLEQAIDAPLGGPLDETRLRDLSRADRLDELDFAVPLGRISAADIGAALAATLAEDDPLLAWARARAHGAARFHGFDLDLEGRLIGSIDLVFRRADPATGQMRYWVADYKTNRLPVETRDRADHLVEAMVDHDYPLQATLYLVALHRYLRWKVPGYDPQTHLGGAAYLFMREMDPNTPPAAARGVFWWTPGVAAVEAVDRVLTGAAPQVEELP